MMCSRQTMLKVGLGMLIVSVTAYAAFPELRTWILKAAPTLVVLLCPLSMLFAMKMMGGKGCEKAGSDQPKIAPSSSANNGPAKS